MDAKELSRKQHKRLSMQAARRLQKKVTARKVHTWAEHMRGALK